MWRGGRRKTEEEGQGGAGGVTWWRDLWTILSLLFFTNPFLMWLGQLLSLHGVDRLCMRYSVHSLQLQAFYSQRVLRAFSPATILTCFVLPFSVQFNRLSLFPLLPFYWRRIFHIYTTDKYSCSLLLEEVLHNAPHKPASARHTTPPSSHCHGFLPVTKLPMAILFSRLCRTLKALNSNISVCFLYWLKFST